jgi:hypothetical protein
MTNLEGYFTSGVDGGGFGGDGHGIVSLNEILVTFQICQGVNFPNQFLPTITPFPLLEEIFMKGFECHDQDSINISRMSRKRHS